MIETIVAEWITHLPLAVQLIIAAVFAAAVYQYRKTHNDDNKAHGDILAELKKISAAISELKTASKLADQRLERLEARIGDAEKDIKDLLKSGSKSAARD